MKNQYGKSCFTGFFLPKMVLFLTVLLAATFTLYAINKKQERIEVTFNEQSCLLEGTSFELQWEHSVEKQWWVEAYEVRAGALLLTDTYFETFGAGSPSTTVESLTPQDHISQEVGESSNDELLQSLRQADYQSRQSYLNEKYKGYVHYQVNQKLPYLNWMISSNVKAVIINQKEILPIYQWVGDYTNIYIAPRKVSLWEQKLKESCHDYASGSAARISD